MCEKPLFFNTLKVIIPENTLLFWDCLHLAWGPLPNAANSSDVPTGLAAEHNKDVLEGKFGYLNFSTSTKKTTCFELFLCVYKYYIFFLSLKLQHCRTIVLLNKLKLLKKLLFQKRRWSCDFPPRETLLPKRTVRFPTKKRWHYRPHVGLPWDSPPPPPESVRTDRRAGVR